MKSFGFWSVILWIQQEDSFGVMERILYLKLKNLGWIGCVICYEFVVKLFIF